LIAATKEAPALAPGLLQFAPRASGRRQCVEINHQILIAAAKAVT
jgi:hypothetical protein